MRFFSKHWMRGAIGNRGAEVWRTVRVLSDPGKSSIRRMRGLGIVLGPRIKCSTFGGKYNPLIQERESLESCSTMQNVLTVTRSTQIRRFVASGTIPMRQTYKRSANACHSLDTTTLAPSFPHSLLSLSSPKNARSCSTRKSPRHRR